MADRHKNTRLAYHFLRKHNGELTSPEAVAKAAGWSPRTARDYFNKNLRPWLAKTGKGVYRIEGMATLTEDEFILRQSQVKSDAYGPELDLREALQSALHSGESSKIEFKQDLPSHASDLGKEIAALAQEGGQIWLGVGDDGVVIGLDSLSGSAGRSDYRERLEGISRSVRPAVAIEVGFIDYAKAVLCCLSIPVGDEPIYYHEHRPYIRDGSQSRPASPDEVKKLIREATNPGPQSDLK